jgi:c-di-GMP-binding flagellar brake protein YcgR
MLDPADVIELLKRLVESHSVVEVAPDEGNRRYTALIVDVDATANRLCLGELDPPTAETALTKGQLVNIAARIPDGAVSFHATVIGPSQSDDIVTQDLELPRLIHILQRRRHPRVPVGEHHDIEVLISASGRPSIGGKLADLSEGGMAVHVDEHTAEEFGLWMGETVKVSLAIPGGHNLHCDFTVRYARLLPGERLLFGGDFIDLDAADIEAITDYTSRLQDALSDLQGQ